MSLSVERKKHHLKLVPAIPADSQKGDGHLEVAPPERGFMMLHEDDPRRVMAWLGSGL